MAKATKTIKAKIHNPNKGKEEALENTVEILNGVLSTYIDFTLAHKYLITQTREVVSVEGVVSTHRTQRTGEVRKRKLNNLEILTEIEKLSLKTQAHKETEIDIKAMYSKLPTLFRRSIINTSTGMCRSYLSNLEKWKLRSKKNKSKNPPAPPTPRNLPTFYKGTYEIELLDIQNQFVRLKVYHKGEWVFINYPIEIGKKQLKILQSQEWKILSPTLVPSVRCVPRRLPKKRGSKTEWYLHIPLEKKVDVKPIDKQKKENPNLTTLSVDMGIKHLAVITVRKDGKIVFVKFFRSEKIESHRLRHLKKIASSQKKSGKSVSGEKSNKALWKHIGEMNDAHAHKVSREIIKIAQKFSVSVIIIEYLRKFRNNKGSGRRRVVEGVVSTLKKASLHERIAPSTQHRTQSRSKKFNRKFTYWLKGKLEFNLRYKALEHSILVKSVNSQFTSQICNKCGGFGERFSNKSLFRCFYCGYTANADFNASVNLHKVFWETFPLPKRNKKFKKPTRKGKVAHSGVC